MIIKDNAREYDMKKFDEYSSMTQGIINRLIYSRFDSIRSLLANNRCNKLRASTLKEMIQNENDLERIKKVFDYSTEEIIFYVDYSIKNFPFVK
ncbi:hypothetical protein [Candidatus Enterococcus murrayae]|uniref:Uncharacterized protein n=1 Tax=Candidatus Enterococcus murrayae TaxID=2815321 RepID=A0ABS3HCW8_9ENTE|nr:hypothetical protein [Enterococcus sp. MJM16]MBO0450765.1 hypothetical protein [Enterococcus sp. MJM16]